MLVGREEDHNRATLIGKIKFFIEGPVKSDREWLSGIISEQWYERNLKKLKHEKILEHVRVKAEFEAVTIEAWDDLVEPVQRLLTILPNMPDAVKLQLLNLEELKSELPEENPNPVQGQQMLGPDGKPVKQPKLPTLPLPTNTTSTAEAKKKLKMQIRSHSRLRKRSVSGKALINTHRQQKY